MLYSHNTHALSIFPKLAPTRTSNRIGAFHFLRAYNGTSSSSLDVSTPALAFPAAFTLAPLPATTPPALCETVNLVSPAAAPSDFDASFVVSCTHHASRGRSRGTISHDATTLGCAARRASSPCTDAVTRALPMVRPRRRFAMAAAMERWEEDGGDVDVSA